MVKIRIDKNKCTGCGVCVEAKSWVQPRKNMPRRGLRTQ
ncbi:MAG: ferredoxin [Candidatus Freyarchaeota archaeon]